MRFYFLYLSAKFKIKLSNFLWTIHRPRFKVGDYIIYNLNYATVVYIVESIKQNSFFTPKYYKLKGIKVVRSDGTSPHMAEAKSYDPFCGWFDKEARKISEKEMLCALPSM